MNRERRTSHKDTVAKRDILIKALSRNAIIKTLFKRPTLNPRQDRSRDAQKRHRNDGEPDQISPPALCEPEQSQGEGDLAECDGKSDEGETNLAVDDHGEDLLPVADVVDVFAEAIPDGCLGHCRLSKQGQLRLVLVHEYDTNWEKIELPRKLSGPNHPTRSLSLLSTSRTTGQRGIRGRSSR